MASEMNKDNFILLSAFPSFLSPPPSSFPFIVHRDDPPPPTSYRSTLLLCGRWKYLSIYLHWVTDIYYIDTFAKYQFYLFAVAFSICLF